MKTRSSLFIFSFLVLIISPMVFGDDIDDRKAAAMAITKEFGGKLGSEMKAAMKAGGPTNAIQVCSNKAPEITGELSRKTGWKVTRVGTRVRNTLLGSPDPWEQKVLAQFQERNKNGESYEKMDFSEVVQEPNGNYFRFMKAIGVQSACLQCHGDKETILPEVQMILEERYPHDHAQNYKAGDLRGAISIKQPM